MNADPLSLELTLELARRARHSHRAVAGGCELCRVPWPCEAAERIEDTITVLEGPPPRAVGRVRIEELRSWGEPFGPDVDRAERGGRCAYRNES